METYPWLLVKKIKYFQLKYKQELYFYIQYSWEFPKVKIISVKPYTFHVVLFQSLLQLKYPVLFLPGAADEVENKPTWLDDIYE